MVSKLSQSRFSAAASRVFCVAVLAALGLLNPAGCSKPAGDAALDSPVSMRKRWIAPAAPPAVPQTHVLGEISVSAIRNPEPEQSPASFPGPNKEAAELAAEFDRETDDARRIELVYQLATNSSPPAQKTLARIYQTLPELKPDVINALTFLQGDDFATALALLQDAARPDRPAELRDAVVGALRDLNSEKTLPVWRTLLNDPASERREAARAAIEYFAP